MATDVASFMTPSPKTSEYSTPASSGRMTCSTATVSVAAKMAPSARQSYTSEMLGGLNSAHCVKILFESSPVGPVIVRPSKHDAMLRFCDFILNS